MRVLSVNISALCGGSALLVPRAHSRQAHCTSIGGSTVFRSPRHAAARSIRRVNLVLASTEGPPSEGAKSDLDRAWKLLLQFNANDIRRQQPPLTVPGVSKEQRAALREAVLVAADHARPSCGWDPDAQPPTLMLGVLSGDVRLAVRALRDYTLALNTDFVMPTSRVAGVSNISGIQGGVYIKHNAASGTATVAEYRGGHRGVLVQFGQQQIGHLPLGLFDEAKAAPAPL